MHFHKNLCSPSMKHQIVQISENTSLGRFCPKTAQFDLALGLPGRGVGSDEEYGKSRNVGSSGVDCCVRQVL